MAIAGEIATMYVRLRPNVSGFATEATTMVRESLAPAQAEVNQIFASGTSTADIAVAANDKVAASYVAVSDAATSSAARVRETGATVATTLADVQAKTAATARANVTADMQTIEANKALAASYTEIADAAVAGSTEAQVATTRAASAIAANDRLISASAAEAGGAMDGLRTHVLSLASILGVGIGAAFTVKFVKDVVGAAAVAQKSTETIRSMFGRAGDALVSFANKGGVALGSAADSTLAATAKFGIMFKSLGIGQQAAAAMTQNWEKLGLAINSIRGGGAAGAEQVLTRLATSASGRSTRALLQMGIAIDQTQEKLIAFKEGLISSTTQALTPGQKALVTYQIAMAHLPQFLAEAKAHSGDLANVQARLSAEFQKAKVALGDALMPVFLKYTTELADWLQRMMASGKLQADFNAGVRTAVDVVKAVAVAVHGAATAFHDLSGILGGTKNLVLALMAAWAVSKIVGVASAFGSTLAPAILKIKTNFAAASAESEGAFATMRAGAIATGVTIKEALISTGIGLVIVAVGVLAAAVITHWDTVKRYTVALGGAIVGVFDGLKTAVPAIAASIGLSVTDSFSMIFYGIAKGASDAFGWVPVIGGKLKDAAKAVGQFHQEASSALTASTKQVADGFSEIGKLSAQNWVAALSKGVGDPTQKSSLTKTGQDAGKAISDGIASTATSGAANVTAAVNKAMQSAIQAANTKITNSVDSAKTNLDKIGGDLAKTIATILEKLGGTGGALAGSPQGQAFAKLKALVSQGAPSFEIARADQSLSSQLQNVAKTTNQSIQTTIANLTDEFNQGSLSAKSFNTKINQLLAQNGVNYKTAGKAGGKAFADQFQAEVTGLREQAGAIAAIPAKYRAAGGGGGDATIKIVRPLEVIQQQQASIAAKASTERARIAKAAEKTAQTLQQFKQLPSTAPLPGHGKTPKGTASQKARVAAAAGVQP